MDPLQIGVTDQIVSISPTATATATIVIKDVNDNSPVCDPDPVKCSVKEDFPINTDLPGQCKINCPDAVS
jgi:hypothetical protein